MLKHIPVGTEATHCSTCMMGSVCLPVGMPATEIAKLDDLVKDRIRLEKGQALYQHGEKLDALFGLRTGSIKTQLDEANGTHQITGFFRGLNSCNARNSQDIAFLGGAALNQRQGAGQHGNAASGDANAFGVCFVCHIHHVGLALGIKVSECGHVETDNGLTSKVASYGPLTYVFFTHTSPLAPSIWRDGAVRKFVAAQHLAVCANFGSTFAQFGGWRRGALGRGTPFG